MIITISGQAGAGKTTVGRLLAKNLGYNYYDIGTLRKIAAKKRGMTIEDYNIYGMTHPETDKDADAETIRLSNTEDDFVIQGRLAYYFIPKSLKVYLSIDSDIAAYRLSLDTDNPERISKSKQASVDTIRRLCMQRDAGDILRYQKIYGIKDFTDKKNYDIIIDTTDITPEQVVEKILTHPKLTK
jgi:predicted cytidylate kinase